MKTTLVTAATILLIIGFLELKNWWLQRKVEKFDLHNFIEEQNNTIIK